MTTRKARTLVLILCVVSILFSMMACDGGDGCYVDGNGYTVCPDNSSFVESGNELSDKVDNINRDISESVDDWAAQHSSGSMDCLSVFDANCQ